jgi:hypothetical protein
VLPFWPSLLVAALVLGAGLAAFVHPRLGLAAALAVPVFPIGNASQSGALLYGALALAVLALAWRDARSGLLFVSGPVLAGVGLLALVPLAVQPARGPARRAAQAAVAVLVAALAAGLSEEALLAAGEPTEPLRIAPVDSPVEVGATLMGALVMSPLVLVCAAVAAAAAAILPWARRRSRFGVLAVGAALLAGVVAAGTGIVSILVVALVWGIAGAVAAGGRG